MTQRKPRLSPEVADAARGVLAIIRTELNGDQEGERAIFDSLDLNSAKLLLAMTANLAATMLRHRNGDEAEEQLVHFVQEYLT